MTHPFFEDLISASSDCAVHCGACTVECLQSPDVERMRECILLTLDCADISRALSALLARNSEHIRDMLAFAAPIFKQCAAVCRKHKDALPTAKSCADVCDKLHVLCDRFGTSLLPS